MPFLTLAAVLSFCAPAALHAQAGGQLDLGGSREAAPFAAVPDGAGDALVAPLQGCESGEVRLRWDGGQARFSVEIADDAGERSQGLMHRKSMARSSGMLFIYPRPAPVSFWMRNTLIPLDMIFLDARGVVQRVHSNAVPLDETPISGGDGILAVLEINGGLAKAFGIAPGAQMLHPAFGSAAAWPCAGQ
ncbi:DUF192 domain-containing protein [Oceanicola sp. 502str15]|nr:DUF192 domain-containing protein [Oceanicola sp. 502str15]